MANAIAKDSADIKKEAGKLKKFFTAVKKFFAKEFLWLLFVLLAALPLAFILNYLIDQTVSIALQKEIFQITNGLPTAALSFGLSVAGIYFTRTVVGAIKTLTGKPKK